MKVLFVDLEAQYRSIRKSIDEALKQSFSEFRFVRGKSVTAFESAFRRTIGAPHCVAASNGTSALFLALKALGVGAGDEVITPAFSWISSSETISLCGATAVFADVDPVTYTLTPALIELCITPKTKAIIVVHLYGQTAPVQEIRRLCKKHNLFLIEDCAQAHLSEDGGSYAGTIGDVGAFSFYPTKNLGAYGDAGCIVTSDAVLAEKIRRIANHGALEKDDHLIEGMNSRMDTIQAAILQAKLPYLKKWNSQRRKNAALYRRLLEDVDGLILPAEQPGSVHTYHLFVIRTDRRDELKKFLSRKGIQTVIHYPKALINTPAYAGRKLDPKDFPVSTLLEKQVLSLPIHPELTESQIRFVCRNIQLFFKKVKAV